MAFVSRREAETRFRTGSQSSLRDSGDNGPRLVPPLKRWAIVSRPWRDYAAWLFLWGKRNLGLLSFNPRSGVWWGLNTLLRPILQISGPHLPEEFRIFPLDFDFRAGMILPLCLTGACRKGVPEGRAGGPERPAGKSCKKRVDNPPGVGENRSLPGARRAGAERRNLDRPGFGGLREADGLWASEARPGSLTDEVCTKVACAPARSKRRNSSPRMRTSNF